MKNHLPLYNLFIILCFIDFGLFSQTYRNHYTEYGVGLMDSAGNVVVEALYEQIDYNFESGFYKVQIEKKSGVIDSFGKLVISPKYDDVFAYGEGLYVAVLNGKVGYLNAKEKVVIPFKYIDASAFYDGFAKVKIKDKYGRISAGMINKKGKVIVPFIYDFTFNFQDGLAIVCSSEEKRFNLFGAVDKKGRIVIPLKYNDLRTFKDGIAIAKLNEMFGIIDKQNRVVADFKYHSISDFQERMAIVYDKSSKKYGFINQLGEEIPLIYNAVENFSEGFAAVKIGEYWAYINLEGRAITEFKYENRPTAFYKGKGSVFIGKRIYINSDGTESDN
jgi:hypothetical protein